MHERFRRAVDLLRGYLNRGGKVWLMLDPPAKVDAKPLTNLIAFAREFGIDVYWVNDAGRIYHKHTSEVVEPYDLHPLPPQRP